MKIVVLAGGTSPERDVSLSTGTMIYKALKANGHKVVLLDVYLGYEGDTRDVFIEDKDWAEGIGSVKEDNPDIDSIKALRKDNPNHFFGPGVIDICDNADIVFLALHGENGENGKVQAAFDLMGIKYTGTDFASSSIAMDKAVSKELFVYYKIPTPAGVHVRKGETYSWNQYPCVVKVNNGGSSVGVSIVHSSKDMNIAMKDALSYGDEIIIEEYIKGREFSVGVIDGKALPVIEIAPLTGFYDYKNKYQAGNAIETCPAKLSSTLTTKMQDLAVKVFYALRLKTYARMDFILDEKDEIYCLEANTLPGMTPTSLLPQEAKAVGIDFNALCELIIKISLEKYNL